MAIGEEQAQARWRARQDRQLRGRPLEKLAHSLGLGLVREDPDLVRLEGTVRGTRVEIERRHRDQQQKVGFAWAVRVERPGIDPRLLLRPQEDKAPLRHRFSPDHRTGDDDFDDRVWVGGDEALASAVLDVATRARVLALFEKGHARIEGGAIHFTRYQKRADQVPRRLQPDLALSLRLARHFVDADRVQGLMQNASKDPLGQVRLRSAELLAQVAPERTQDLPRRSFRALLDLLNYLSDSELRPELIERLSALLKAPGMAAGLDLLIEKKPRQGRRLLAILGDDAPELIPALEEGALLLLLDVAGKSQKLLVYEQLGARGGREALEALVGHTSGLFRRASHKEAARRAVAQIEARSGLHRGGLAVLAEAEVGGLAVTDGASGRLALSEDP